MCRSLITFLAIASVLHFSFLDFATATETQPKKVSRKPSSTNSIASSSKTPTKNVKSEVTEAQRYHAAVFLDYVQKPQPQNFAQVLGTLEGFVPADSFKILKAQVVDTKAQMPKFHIQYTPSMKVVFQDNLKVFSADIFEKDKSNYIKVNGKLITHADMLKGTTGVEALISATKSKTSRFNFFEILIPEAHAYMWPLAIGIGMIAIGFGIWFGLKSLAKSTHRVEVTGVPTTFTVNIPQEYRVNTEHTINTNINGQFNATASGTGTGTLNLNGSMTNLSGNITNATVQGIQSAINGAVNSINSQINSRTGGNQ